VSKEKTGSTRHRGKPKGIARKLASSKEDLQLKNSISVWGNAAAAKEYPLFMEAREFLHYKIAGSHAERTFLEAVKTAVRNDDAEFFRSLAKIIERLRDPNSGLADPLGTLVCIAVSSLKGVLKKPASVKNVRETIDKYCGKLPCYKEYDDREIRRAMKGLGIPVEKGH